MIFEAWSLADPVGTKLGDLTEAFDKEIQVELNGLGSGAFKIRQDSPQAAWCVADTHIRVRWEPGDPYLDFSFLLESGQDAIVSTDEEGGEVWQRGGRGSLAYVEPRAIVYPTETIAGPAIVDSEGKWVYTDVSYGAILNDQIAQAKARTPDPLEHMIDGISGTVDGNGTAWPPFDGTFEVPAGMNLLSLIKSLQSQGLIVRMANPLTIKAYSTYTRDKTATVQFEKGVNIRESAERQIVARPTRTRVLVQRADGTHQEVTDASTATLEAGSVGRREGFTMYRHSSSPAVITRAGQQFLRKTRAQRAGPTTIGVESDEFVPWVDYREGDTVDVHIPGIWNHYAATIVAITVNEDATGTNLVTLDFEQVPFDPFTDMQSAIDDMIHGPGCKPGCGHGGGTTPDFQGNAPLEDVSRSINGTAYDGIGSYDGALFATWDTGNSSIYHSDAQPKAGSRHHIDIPSICYPLFTGYDGVHQMYAGAKFHVGGTDSATPVGIITLHSELAASHGTGWPNFHPRFGPFSLHVYKYLAGNANDDAPAIAAHIGTIVGQVSDIGPSSNGDEKEHVWEGSVDLSDIPYDGTCNFMLVWKPLWEVGGYTCLGSLDPEGGFGEIHNTYVVNVQAPVGPGWYTGPVGGTLKDGTEVTFDVPYGYTEVREVTVNGIEMPPNTWIADDGATITFIGWSPIEADDVQVKRYIPAPV